MDGRLFSCIPANYWQDMRIELTETKKKSPTMMEGKKEC